MKNFLFLLIVLFVSCKDQIDIVETNELQPSASTSTELIYPTGSGTSGDAVYGLLGYGYDVTGFCDTISVKAKVFATLPVYNIYLGSPTSAFPTLINGGSFDELSSNINYAYDGSGLTLIQHLESLMKLANTSHLNDTNFAYTYYAFTCIYKHKGFYTNSDNQQYLSAEFKNDVVILSPKDLILRYGTHVLTNVYSGTQFEVLYRCKFNNPSSGSVCEDLFYNRMKEYVGGTPYIYKGVDSNTKHFQTNETFIYNSIGSKKKLCGVINATDYNPDSIHINVSQLFTESNINSQFVSIGKNGIFPIYELIIDETKKQEVKAYIEKYMVSKIIN